MYPSLRASLRKYVALNDEQCELIEAHGKIVSFPKKHFVLQNGEVCRHVYFTLEGCLRFFSNQDKIEQNFAFWFEEEWFSEYTSFLTQQPTMMNIQTLEPTKVFAISYDNVQKLYDLEPSFDRFGRKLIEEIFIGISLRKRLLLTETPESLYRGLIEKNSRLLHRISQHHIASYLGITPVSLSRIRKRVQEQ